MAHFVQERGRKKVRVPLRAVMKTILFEVHVKFASKNGFLFSIKWKGKKKQTRRFHLPDQR